MFMALGITKQQKLMVAVLLSGSLLTVLNLTVLSPALPTIMQDMNVDATTVQWLSSGYGLVEAVVIPLSAWLLGRFRTRQLFIAGELIFACGSLISLFAPTFPLLLLGRLMQAAATGIVMTMAMTLNILIFPREKRGTAMGIVGLIIGFAPAIGPSLGGIVSDLVGWRALFGLVFALTLLVVVFASRILTDFKGFERTRFDVPSVILSSLGLLSFLYGVSTITSSQSLLVPLACLVTGVILIVIFVRRQNKLETPFLRVDILKTRRYRIAVIVIVCLQATLIGSNVVFPLFIQQVLGQTATTSGLIMLPGALLGALCGFFSGRLFDRLGIRPLALVGGAFIFIAGILLSLLNSESSVLAVVLTSTVFGFSIQMLFTPINTWGLNSLDNSNIPHANAVSNTVNQVAGSFGTALIVSLSALSFLTIPEASTFEQTATGYHYSFMGAAVLLTIACLIVVFFARNKKGEDAARPQVKETLETSDEHYSLGSVMNENSMTLASEASVEDALRAFSQASSSGATIVDQENRVVGFLSTGDILKYLGDVESSLATISNPVSVFHLFEDENFKDRVADLLKLNVMDIATKKVITINKNTSLEKACTILSSNHIKKLPVVENDKFIGAISRKNVVNAIVKALE